MAKSSGGFGVGTIIMVIIAYNVFFSDDESDNKTVQEIKETTKQVVEVVKEKAPEVAEDIKKAVAETKKEKDVMDEWTGKKEKETEERQGPISSSEEVSNRFKDGETFSDRFK